MLRPSALAPRNCDRWPVQPRAPLHGVSPASIAGGWRFAERNERWLEAERGQIVLWIPVMLGVGIAAWFALPDANRWGAVVLGGLAVAAAGLALGGGGRAARCPAVAGLLVAIGCALVWWRAERLAAPVLARPAIVAVQGKVERVEKLPARDMVRLRIAPDAGAGLPPMVRVNLDSKDVPAGLTRGAVVKLRARLMPPAPPPSPAPMISNG
ncbi:hypothetical protein DdX_22073 [Ditylenchus destructor]|uniref:Competence protein ComEC n=1 Tax=Ditylenchus destructor TaxID=166010 RepID=A0AAD4ME01_9BILA|nr:hypothetical protein DdX_22073 [Ditylenchus destructor]